MMTMTLRLRVLGLREEDSDVEVEQGEPVGGVVADIVLLDLASVDHGDEPDKHSDVEDVEGVVEVLGG